MFRIAVAQVNPTVGDMKGNGRLILDAIDTASRAGAALVALPELAVCGYPPEDLIFHPSFLEAQARTVEEIAAAVGDMLVLMGFVEARGGKVYNAAALLHRGAVAAVYRKIHLPKVGVFDEERYFTPGDAVLVLDWAGLRVGVSICEDIWTDGSVLAAQAGEGARLLVNLSSSPYHRGNWRERGDLVSRAARDTGCHLAFANLVGGQDELVFDGRSFVADPTGETLAEADPLRPALLLADLDLASVVPPNQTRGERPSWPICTVTVPGSPPEPAGPPAPRLTPAALEDEEDVYGALVVGTRDYVRKTGFTDVVLGVSGGVDSALVAAVACDGLGPEHVHGVAMPSEYSSPASLEDAKALASRFDFDLLEVPIAEPFDAFRSVFRVLFAGCAEDVTEENIQARIRGNLLMALSNKHGWLVLTTGNKSEVSVGYSTLYGDTAGGLAVISDVFKTLVYSLSRWRNRKAGRDLIPDRILKRPPTAELKPDQTDQDNLPPYEVLDPILEAYVEHNRSVQDMVGAGFDEETVRAVVNLVNRAEYKRRQLPPGVKITPRAFGRDRRMPIANRFRA